MIKGVNFTFYCYCTFLGFLLNVFPRVTNLLLFSISKSVQNFSRFNDAELIINLQLDQPRTQLRPRLSPFLGVAIGK